MGAGPVHPHRHHVRRPRSGREALQVLVLRLRVGLPDLHGEYAQGEAGGDGRPEVAVGGVHGLRLPVRDHGQPLAVRRVRGRHQVAQARAGLPGGRRPQDQHLPGRRPPRPSVRGVLLPRRAGAGPGPALQVPLLAAALRAAQRHRVTDPRRPLRGRPLLGGRRGADHGRPHPRAAPGRRDDGPARRRDRPVPAHRAGDGDGRPPELPRPARAPGGELELALLPGQPALDEQAARVRDQQQPARRVADPARAAGA